MIEQLLALTKLLLTNEPMSQKEPVWEKNDNTEKIIIMLNDVRISDEKILAEFKRVEKINLSLLSNPSYSFTMDQTLIQNIIKKTRPDLAEKINSTILTVHFDNLLSCLEKVLSSKNAPSNHKIFCVESAHDIISQHFPQYLTKLEFLTNKYKIPKNKVEKIFDTYRQN